MTDDQLNGLKDAQDCVHLLNQLIKQEITVQDIVEDKQRYVAVLVMMNGAGRTLENVLSPIISE